LANAEWFEFLSEGLNGKHTTDLQQGSYYETPSREGLGHYEWSGPVNFKLGPENGIGRVLTELMGNPASTASVDGLAIRHIWESTGAIGYTARSMSTLITRSIANGQKQFEYLGGGSTRIGIEGVVDQDVRAAVELMGDQDAIKSGSPDTEPATLDPREYFRHFETKWQIGATPVTDADVEAWAFQFESALEVVPQVNSRFGRRLFRGGVSLTGRVDRDFVDTLYYSRFYGSDTATTPQTTLTAQNVVIDLVGEATGSVNAGFLNYQLKIELPKLKFFENTANLSGRDRITQGVPYVVLRDPTVAYAARITLINKRATTFYSA